LRTNIIPRKVRFAIAEKPITTAVGSANTDEALALFSEILADPIAATTIWSAYELQLQCISYPPFFLGI
jgi:hypothetical protein